MRGRERNNFKSLKKKQLWLPLSPLQLQSQSQPASASISYFIFHTTFNANCAQLQLKLVTLFAPFLQFFLRFLLFLMPFLGVSFVQGNLDRSSSSSSGSDCDCILGAHSSVPHYSPIHPLATQSKAHKYNETQTHTHRHTRFYRLSLFTLGFSNKCFANNCGRCFGICYSL